MQRYRLEILQVSPPNLLCSLDSAYNDSVRLEAQFVHTGAVAAYTPHSRLGDGVLDIRSPLAADEVRIALALPAPAAQSQSSAAPCHRHTLAASRQLVVIGGPTRSQGACWVSLCATTPHGAMLDTSPEIGKVQLMWSVEALTAACTAVSPTPGGLSPCLCTPQQRGCVCDAQSGTVMEHCPHCPLHTAEPRAELDRRESAMSAPSRVSLVSEDVAIDASSMFPRSDAAPGARGPSRLPTLGADGDGTIAANEAPPTTTEDGSAANQQTPESIATQTSRVWSPEAGTTAHEAAAGMPTLPVPLSSLTTSDAPVVPGTNDTHVTTARWAESDPHAVPDHNSRTPRDDGSLTRTGNDFDFSPTPSPSRGDGTQAPVEANALSQLSADSPPDPSLPARPSAPQHVTFLVADNIVYLASAAPDDDWQEAMNCDGVAGDESDPIPNRREMNHFLLQSFPAAEVTMSRPLRGATAVETMTDAPVRDAACGTGTHIDYYATSTQVGVPVSRAVNNLYTRPSPIVHLAAERSDYPGLRTALQSTEGLEQLYTSYCRAPKRTGALWLNSSALDSIRTERTAGATAEPSTTASMDTMRDRLDLLMALSDAERNPIRTASTPEQEATLEMLKDHAMKALMRPTVQYGVA